MAIAEKYKLRSGNLVLDWAKEYHRHRNSVEETLSRNASVPPQHGAPPHTDAPDETVSVIPPLQLFHFF